MKKSLYALALLVGSLQLTGCATTEETSKNDPFEGYNRAIFSFNEGLDKIAVKPLAKGYKAITPDAIENSIDNFFENLLYPRTILNQLLQGKLKIAAQDTARFLTNTTLGIGGFFDVATGLHLEEHYEDFGQTLGSWGVTSGPYVVLPLFGPSNMRDGLAKIPDIYTSPITHINDNEVRYSLMALDIISYRAELLDKEDLISGDKYIFLRDAYMQRREFMINDEKTEENDPFLNDK